MMMPWNTQELKRLYNQTESGHWFDPDSMRFFKSRLTPYFKRLDDTTAIFVTTEQGPTSGSKRAATLRLATITAEGKIGINTIGEFNKLTLYMAKKKLKDYVHDEKN